MRRCTLNTIIINFLLLSHHLINKNDRMWNIKNIVISVNVYHNSYDSAHKYSISICL